MNGRPLHFRLWGINNQNFIMRDEETGSWWQQVTGEAILGPLKGQRLTLMMHDELSFALWKSETPNGRVLKPDPGLASAKRYAEADWEDKLQKMPTVKPLTDRRLEPRALVAGVSVDNGQATAYPVAALKQQSPIVDTVGPTPVLVVMGDDGKSVRVFERPESDGRALEFFRKPAATPLVLVDSATGSEWDFTGRAVSGPLAGRQLKKIPVLLDYWFDWQAYHPSTAVYGPGAR